MTNPETSTFRRRLVEGSKDCGDGDSIRLSASDMGLGDNEIGLSVKLAVLVEAVDSDSTLLDVRFFDCNWNEDEPCVVLVVDDAGGIGGGKQSL